MAVSDWLSVAPSQLQQDEMRLVWYLWTNSLSELDGSKNDCVFFYIKKETTFRLGFMQNSCFQVTIGSLDPLYSNAKNLDYNKTFQKEVET